MKGVSSPGPVNSRPPPIVMKGGAKEQMIDIVKKYAAPLNVYFGVAIVLLITYVGKIPDSVASFADSFLGRGALFLLTLFIASLYSWVYAVLIGLFAVLLLAVAPRSSGSASGSGKEGFHSSLDGKENTVDTDVKLITQKKKWWIEEVMGENPIGIEEEKVKTSAIQDNTNSSSSTTSSR